MDTDAGQIPVVKTEMLLKDILATVGARAGITRNNYRVIPGLYAAGKPDENSEVLVTANFKLTFDILRKNLEKLNVWILVLDTVGVNVWCAAGKGTFSTKELVRRIELSGLDKVVKHRRLILPQLSATGISAKDVKKMCGFSVIYGPVRAQDIQAFLENGRKADPYMRQVTFTFAERIILTPVELNIAMKYVVMTAVALLVISGIGPGIFSLKSAGERGWISIVFLLTGLLSGAVVTPALLPLLPFKEFAAKGIISGSLFALCALFISSASSLGMSAMIALFLFGTAISSFLAMNFTGSTPFTSPSGVEREMKQFIPVQAGAVVISLVLWIYSAF
ncbi:MAG: hypothetical protein HQK61_03580 [Desulfamplus sp.]|nr:hypothetical protein [Desulfamplus sp.]